MMNIIVRFKKIYPSPYCKELITLSHNDTLVINTSLFIVFTPLDFI